MKELHFTDTYEIVGKLFKHCLSSYRHSQRVGDELYRFANYLKMSDLDLIYLVGLTHDIGKLHIPETLLNKKERLTLEEFERIKLHTEYGQEIIKGIKELPDEFSSIVKFHHENYDGTGYYGQSGKDIPLLARMIRIIDSYDTMLHGRIYQTSKTQFDVITEICSLSGKHYDPELTAEYKDFLNERYYLNQKTGS
ncbi:HD domain-containing protein [Neobacillus notoginsengisoli]|uniref:HD domain-containing protein n=1 Tax=Neobacillus notoginsengisoli TaxID=1578198 RepID=A0A417YPP8_9BACI|nr:HD domain-containing phosphohydrolase [Neobacillus notoginsengisoli]RHW35965.1 HD domain-containing protein [Neobacillus notoginsengisoli]